MSDQPPLTRNSSFSKLNAEAPEFVPMKPTHSPLPSSLAFDSRLAIVPPVPIPHLRHFQPPYNHHHYYSNSSSGGTIQRSNKDQGIVVSSNCNGLSDDAARKVINQVEYYFSDMNLATTNHLIKFIFKDPEGFVPISVVASFKKIKTLISSNSQLAAVLRNSTQLVVSDDGMKVKRLCPLTISDREKLQAHIIVVENLPEDHSHQNLMKVFSVVGSVKSIRTCQPPPSNNGAASASRSPKADNPYYNNKLHAFVEYESVELADKAIAEVNVKDSGRNDFRVRPLLKQALKPPQRRAKTAGNEGEVHCKEKSVSTLGQKQNENPSEHTTGEPDGQSHELGEQSMDKEGFRNKSHNTINEKGRGKGHNHYQDQNHHHETNKGRHLAAKNDQPVAVKQHPPGPRMPDGSRGFSMGRGRPLTAVTA